MKRTIALLLLTLTILTPVLAASAATTTKATRIYGTEELAIACKGWDEFYAGQMFVWFQIDLDVKTQMTGPLMNQQVLGDAVLKKAVNDKIKMNGLTVRQINAQSGNPYGAMIAFEPATTDGATNPLRISVWLSWGSTAVQELFKKENNEYFTFEILSGMQVPDMGYTRAAPVYADMTPVKYRVALETLEFKKDPSNPGYSEEKKDWVRPMFEDFTAKWQLVGAASPTPTKAPTGGATTTPGATTEATPTAGTDVTPEATTEATPTAEATEEATPTAEATAPADATATPAPTQAPDAGSGFPVLPVVLGGLGVLVIAGGVAFYLKAAKKA